MRKHSLTATVATSNPAQARKTGRKPPRAAPAPVDAPMTTDAPAPVATEIQNPNESKSQNVLDLTPAPAPVDESALIEARAGFNYAAGAPVDKDGFALGGDGKRLHQPPAPPPPVCEADIDHAIDEPVPQFDPAGEEHVGVAFVQRMHSAESGINRKCAFLQWKMGKVLVAFKTGPQGKHGKWLKFIETHFPFSDQTARNYIEVAVNCSEEDARSMTVSELYRKAGILPDPGQKRGKSVFSIYSEFNAAVFKIEGLLHDFSKSRLYCRAIDQHFEHLPESYEKTATNMLDAMGGLNTQVESAINDFRAHLDYLKRGGDMRPTEPPTEDCRFHPDRELANKLWHDWQQYRAGAVVCSDGHAYIAFGLGGVKQYCEARTFIALLDNPCDQVGARNLLFTDHGIPKNYTEPALADTSVSTPGETADK